MPGGSVFCHAASLQYRADSVPSAWSVRGVCRKAAHMDSCGRVRQGRQSSASGMARINRGTSAVSCTSVEPMPDLSTYLLSRGELVHDGDVGRSPPETLRAAHRQGGEPSIPYGCQGFERSTRERWCKPLRKLFWQINFSLDRGMEGPNHELD